MEQRVIIVTYLTRLGCCFLTVVYTKRTKMIQLYYSHASTSTRGGGRGGLLETHKIIHGMRAVGYKD